MTERFPYSVVVKGVAIRCETPAEAVQLTLTIGRPKPHQTRRHVVEPSERARVAALCLAISRRRDDPVERWVLELAARHLADEQNALVEQIDYVWGYW